MTNIETLKDAACSRCFFFGNEGEGNFPGSGLCRRFPPTPMTGLPEVAPKDFCGEFRARPVAKAKKAAA